MYTKRFGWFLLVLLALAGCHSKEPFTPKGWNDGDGIDFPRRYLMVDDLLANHKLKGLTYIQVIQLLKAPQRNSYTDRSFSYEITRKMDILDTLYIKNLVFYLNKDSIVTDFKIYEKTNKKRRPKG